MRAWTWLVVGAGLAGCSGAPESLPEEQEPQGVDLEGATYLLEINNVQIPAAPDLASLLQLALPVPILLQAHDVSDASVSLRMATGVADSDPVVQDLCTRTLELPKADRTGDDFAAGPADMVGPADWTLYDTEISGSLGADGESFGPMSLSGVADARQIAPFFPMAEDAAELCTIMGDLGLSCGPCGDDEPYCIEVLIENASGDRVDVAVEPIAELDPSCP
jgi:hypothetical protein